MPDLLCFIYLMSEWTAVCVCEVCVCVCVCVCECVCSITVYVSVNMCVCVCVCVCVRSIPVYVRTKPVIRHRGRVNRFAPQHLAPSPPPFPLPVFLERKGGGGEKGGGESLTPAQTH